MERRELHLGLNVLSDGMHPAAWRAPYTDPVGFMKPSQWQQLVQVAERGTLDAIFLADNLHLAIDDNGKIDQPPLALDPIVLLSTLASQTSHVGLVATVSTSFEEPYNVARRIASLDHLSGGRAAWNIVTTAEHRASANYGARPQPPREERYARADEFVEVVRALWDSWDDDAMVADQGSGVFTAPRRIRAIDHHGAYFKVAGPLNLPRSPQGQPVLFQAGGSEGGLELAARHADAVFTSQATLPDALAYARDLRERTSRHGRPADAVRIMPGLSFILGGTETEARRRAFELNELAGDRRLAIFAWQLGVDVHELAWDRELPPWLFDKSQLSRNSQGARDIVLNLARRERLTVRQLLDRIQSWHRLVIGDPEQLAATIAEWFEAGAVDGFNLMPDVEPSGIEAFVDHVIPILRRRGIFRREYKGATLRDHLGLARPSAVFPSGISLPSPPTRLEVEAYSLAR
ncbi:LLM class flavin-dependent oxidoreductase [Arboricoccus pini]|nr:LLM class flavin-dependent oxidoreductase [Arboricoccus pini]